MSRLPLWSTPARRKGPGLSPQSALCSIRLQIVAKDRSRNSCHHCKVASTLRVLIADKDGTVISRTTFPSRPLHSRSQSVTLPPTRGRWGADRSHRSRHHRSAVGGSLTDWLRVSTDATRPRTLTTCAFSRTITGRSLVWRTHRGAKFQPAVLPPCRGSRLFAAVRHELKRFLERWSANFPSLGRGAQRLMKDKRAVEGVRVWHEHE